MVLTLIDEVMMSFVSGTPVAAPMPITSSFDFAAATLG